uniref:Uncharacterized protein n=1 Tax=Zea mays TaxID=4577 RepID=A0A804RQT9_MAIZE
MPWAPHRPSASSLCSPVSLPPCAHHAGRRSQPSTLPSPGRGGLRSSSASPSTESPRPCAATCSPRPCQGLLRTPTSSPSPATVSKVMIHSACPRAHRMDHIWAHTGARRSASSS